MKKNGQNQMKIEPSHHQEHHYIGLQNNLLKGSKKVRELGPSLLWKLQSHLCGGGGAEFSSILGPEALADVQVHQDRETKKPKKTLKGGGAVRKGGGVFLLLNRSRRLH